MTTRTKLAPSRLILTNLSVVGGATYEKEILKEETNGAVHEKDWKTKRRIMDKAERDEAISMSGRLQTKIKNDLGAVKSVFGLHVALEKASAEKIEDVISDVRDEVRAFNAKSRFTKVNFNPIIIEVQSGDRLAMQALMDNFTEMFNNLKLAMAANNIDATSTLVNKLVGFDQILPAGRGAELTELVKAVRKQCRSFNKIAKEKGEAAAKIKAELDNSVVDRARFVLFGNDDAVDDDQDNAMPATDVARFEMLDVERDEPDDLDVEEETETAEPEIMEAVPVSVKISAAAAVPAPAVEDMGVMFL